MFISAQDPSFLGAAGMSLQRHMMTSVKPPAITTPLGREMVSVMDKLQASLPGSGFG
jgi:hypothetical protein